MHGITTAFATKNGEKLKDIITIFCKDLVGVKLVVAHNMSYDISIVNNELVRCKMLSKCKIPKTFCTMREYTNTVAIPSKR